MCTLMTFLRRRSTFAWLCLVLPAATFLAATVRGPLAEPVFVHVLFAFWSVLAITTLCVVGAIVVVVIGCRRRLAEVAILGSALLAVSVLPLVHGLTIPGVLMGDNSATVVAALVSVPAGLAIAMPLILPDLGISRAVAARWRLWSGATIVGSVTLATVLLLEPNLIAAPHAGDPVTIVVIGGSLAGTFALSVRHLHLYQVGRRRASLVVAAAFTHLGLSTLVFLVEHPFSLAWWGAHVADAIGVFGGIFGLAFAHNRDRALAFVLAPVVDRDPLVALELGLTPVVHEFLAALDSKDRTTRDHVVRVGELAMRCGVRAGLTGERLRTLGLGALLHDIGKLAIPDEVLVKPGRLTDEEFAVIRRHTVLGDQLLRGSPLLAPAADLVRWHHERVDGTGYPDGVRSNQLPLEVNIISVCDAWDAITSSRPYQQARVAARGHEILRAGAGSQWTARAVDLVLDELDANGVVTRPVDDGLGRVPAGRVRVGGPALGNCADALSVQAFGE